MKGPVRQKIDRKNRLRKRRMVREFMERNIVEQAVQTQIDNKKKIKVVG